jgi:hypothetical protein
MAWRDDPTSWLRPVEQKSEEEKKNFKGVLSSPLRETRKQKQERDNSVLTEKDHRSSAGDSFAGPASALVPVLRPLMQCITIQPWRRFRLSFQEHFLEMLEKEAQARGASKSSLVRECFEKSLSSTNTRGQPHCYDLARDLAGSIKNLRRNLATIPAMERLRPPLITCEAVLTESAFLLKREGAEADALFALLERGVLRIGLRLEEELADVRALMRRYKGNW